ncbi:hypothetical protein ABZ484_06805 [Streptomyces sp. NPDC006393]|uniref:hypothetical protein n=1 Tax=Streptomyces sp. NPDC006393 TaxID=3156763 RepID=UPI0033D8A015
MSDTERLRSAGRLLAGLAWLVLLLGVWEWGSDRADERQGPVRPATVSGDMAAVGRPMEDNPPPAPSGR